VDTAPVCDIMTSSVACVREDASLSSVMTTMVDRSIGALPVVDADGRAIGIVSKTDVLRSLVHANEAEAHGGATVHDVMTSPVLTVQSSDPIDVVAAFMAYERVHHVPILDDHRRVVGMVSSLDVTRWLARALGFFVRG
jgi:CBS-domain-containing membrane protein